MVDVRQRHRAKALPLLHDLQPPAAVTHGWVCWPVQTCIMLLQCGAVKSQGPCSCCIDCMLQASLGVDDLNFLKVCRHRGLEAQAFPIKI
jgi:hypothetical protein